MTDAHDLFPSSEGDARFEQTMHAPHKDPAPPVTDLGHEVRPGTRKRLIAVAVTVPAVLAATVGGYLLGTQSSGPAADTNSSVSGEETHASGETTKGEPAAASEVLVPNWETVLAFNDAKGEAGTEAMKSLVSPGSPAERWLKHREIADSTTVAAGRTPVAIWGSSVIDEAAGTVRTTYRYGGTIVTKDYVTDGCRADWCPRAAAR